MRATLLLLVVGFVVALSAVARADENPYFTVTGCESTIVDGQTQTRMTFRLHNASPYVISIFDLRPDYTQPADSCWAVANAAPEHWFAGVQDRGVAYYRTGGDYPLAPGESLEGFTVTYGHSLCCVIATFSFGAGIFDSTQLCFHCPLATPAQASSWGSLKATYR